MEHHLPLFALAFLALPAAAPSALAQGEADAPQDAWMVHVDGGNGTLRFVPERIILVPGGTVQLMIFGNGHGRYSITLDDAPALEAEVDTAGPGVVHVAELAAPTTPGEYAFHDRHHPEAKGVLVVKAVSAAGDAPRVGVGNGYDTRFYPERIEVRAGEPILFTNNASEIIHTMTAADGSFDADAVPAGEERTIAAPTTPGEYAFVCKYHESSGMRGVLVVLPAAGAGNATVPTETSPSPAALESAEPPRGTPGTPLALLVGVVALGALALSRFHRKLR